MYIASYNVILKIFILFLFGIFLTFPARAAELKIGVRSHSGIDKTISKWQPTADYLTRNIPKHRFVIVPYIKLSGFTKNSGSISSPLRTMIISCGRTVIKRWHIWRQIWLSLQVWKCPSLKRDIYMSTVLMATGRSSIFSITRLNLISLLKKQRIELWRYHRGCPLTPSK